MKTCPKCQSEMEFKSGTGKSGKPYAGWFCKAPRDTCGNVEWEGRGAAPATPAGRYVEAQKKPLDSVKTMLMSYAKDLVCAQIAAGEKSENPVDETLRLFRILYDEYQKV